MNPTAATKFVYLLALASPALAVAQPADFDPFLGCYTQQADDVTWLLHISDTHVGKANGAANLAETLVNVLPTINPSYTVNTGDLVDGLFEDECVWSQVQAQWDHYQIITSNGGLDEDNYMDLPGNHDVAGDLTRSFYDGNTITGADFPANRRRLIQDGERAIVLHGADTTKWGDLCEGEWTADEREAMESNLDAAYLFGAQVPLVFGHFHDADDGGQFDAAMQAMADRGAVRYIHGHQHTAGRRLHGTASHSVVKYRVGNLNNASAANLAVLAIDNGAVVHQARSLSDPWPFVVVTAPVSHYTDVPIASCIPGPPCNVLQVDPYAYSVDSDGEDPSPVRALIFDPLDLQGVTVSACFDDPTMQSGCFDLQQDPSNLSLWTGSYVPIQVLAGAWRDATLSVGVDFGNGVYQGIRTITFRADPLAPPVRADDC